MTCKRCGKELQPPKETYCSRVCAYNTKKKKIDTESTKRRITRITFLFDQYKNKRIDFEKFKNEIERTI